MAGVLLEEPHPASASRKPAPSKVSRGRRFRIIATTATQARPKKPARPARPPAPPSDVSEPVPEPPKVAAAPAVFVLTVTVPGLKVQLPAVGSAPQPSVTVPW